MCFRYVGQFTRYIVFSGCFLVVSSGLGTTLIIKPIQQQSVSSSATPFPPRLSYHAVRSGSSHVRSHHSPAVNNDNIVSKNTITRHDNIVQLATLKSWKAAQSNRVNNRAITIDDSIAQPSLLGQNVANDLNISPLIFNPLALQLSPVLAGSKNSSYNSANRDSIWATLSGNFSLDHNISRPEVNAQIAKWRRNKQDLYQTLKVAAPYISYVYEQTRKRGLPAELALLPIIESEFNPNDSSSRGATGIWQIMPGTASELGLKNHSGYDGRRDIVASTNAALTYLRDLHQTLGNWQLALAAYNWGPNNIVAAVRRQGRNAENRSFWNLNRLPTETRVYVPKFLALAEMIQNPQRYDIKLPATDNAMNLTSVKVRPHLNLKQVAESAGISETTMRKLNPGYRNMATVPGAPNALLLPAEKIALLAWKDRIIL